MLPVKRQKLPQLSARTAHITLQQLSVASTDTSAFPSASTLREIFFETVKMRLLHKLLPMSKTNYPLLRVTTPHAVITEVTAAAGDTHWVFIVFKVAQVSTEELIRIAGGK
ncbi:hypothetical protein EXN66_Car021057 [Channa argus]|uniref:Uncharacterized protein n=1 Tax=Channa argus TaxID=215402 RepID=A0A6G1QTG2_CHAAH|nr:hypothetical protein EXN66_Car021057 [Channa argus]